MGELFDLTKEFASCVFTEEKMERYVPSSEIVKYRRCLETGESLSMDTADAIAKGMKEWAISMGATHYCHWFQPMTGGTAEKHEGFISPVGKGRIIMDFSGKELVKGEPDASSFPSGGLRATFEARGYSAWDPTSYAFIVDGSLCIPTVFFSYSGESLDQKTPLLRSVRALNTQALRILRLFGDKETRSVSPMAGAEQEYFLIDKELFNRREDLRICGRTLFGAKPPKTQELNDHYFGSIKPRVSAFMKDYEKELWKLGVLAKTKHNEVAPSQHEMAPIYSDCNSANDQNQLTMNILRQVADRHNLVCLLAEKPFDGVNGSGKHNNWSIVTDKGKNLISPGKTPSQNAQFLLFLAAFVSAVDEYQDLLRCSVAYAGNDNRLGGHEAPPAIISIFVGTELQGVIDSIIQDRSYDSAVPNPIRIGIDSMPVIPKDTTDRNRTSPIAFTGNKFEFRMPGSSQSISAPNTVLNTIMAQKLCEYANILEQTDAKNINNVLHDLIKDEFTKHSRIIFNGNGYDSSWVEEARRRGLSNYATTAEAMRHYLDPKNIALMEGNGVMSESEMRARKEIYVEKYCNVISIEANTLKDMVRREIIPAVSAFEGELCRTISYMKEAFTTVQVSDVECDTCTSLMKCNKKMVQLERQLESALAKASASGADDMSGYFHDKVLSLMEKIREVVNEAEVLTPDRFWPYPTYSQLLFSE
ncbi:MAG: glutamine synthetase III [Spirochaetales bacterium]|nr:glutamine synthetase III [Spirochaetales bacterium]